MNRHRLILWLWLTILVTVSAASADQPRDLLTLFPQQAPIVLDGGGFARLALPPAVLASCRADLSDLRVFDLEDNEVPYLVDSGLRPEEAIEVMQRITPELLAVDRRRTDRETGPSLWEESYVLRAPEEPPVTGRWDLVIVSEAPSFVRRLRVDQMTDQGSQKILIDQASIFRLAGPTRERIEVTLPDFSGGRLVQGLKNY